MIDTSAPCCRMCHKVKPLKNSHIIPKFVSRWHKQMGDGRLRGGENPNVLIQDGHKEKLLCNECEERLNTWETPFSRQVFVPVHNEHAERRNIIPYEDWMLKFCVSVSWRVLEHLRPQLKNNLSAKVMVTINNACEQWRLFLRGDADTIGDFQQHLLIPDLITAYQGQKISPYFNRYLLTVVDADFASNENHSIVFTKMGKICLFGLIQQPEQCRGIWSGTLVQATSGKLFDGNCLKVPNNVLLLLNDKADNAHRILSGISDKQIEKNHKWVGDNRERYEKSTMYRASLQDRLLSE